MRKALSLLAIFILMISCTLSPTPEPTAIPTASNTPEPTKTPAPTETAVPTETVAGFDPNAMAMLAVVDGFTVSVPYPLLHEVNKSQIIVGNEERTLTISFASDSLDSGDTLEDVLNSYLRSLENRGFTFTRSDPAEIKVDGAPGILIDLTATADQLNFEGQALAVSPRAGFVLFGLGLSKINSDPESWKTTGQAAFNTLLESLKFTETGGTCPISTDETYGYTEQNPIRVGGDFVSGVSRQRAYLDHLLGPNGESLSYERQGSLPSGDTILDIYNITGSGINETLYVDLYSFSELYAPVGFTCEGPFPLSAP